MTRHRAFGVHHKRQNVPQCIVKLVCGNLAARPVSVPVGHSRKGRSHAPKPGSGNGNPCLHKERFCIHALTPLAAGVCPTCQAPHMAHL